VAFYVRNLIFNFIQLVSVLLFHFQIYRRRNLFLSNGRHFGLNFVVLNKGKFYQIYRLTVCPFPLGRKYSATFI